MFEKAVAFPRFAKNQFLLLMKNVFNWSLMLFAVALVACGESSNQKGDAASDAPFTTKTAEEGGYHYEYVTDDPTKTRIYTLKNGLKAYISVYKNEPRAQVSIAVKAVVKTTPQPTPDLHTTSNT